MNQKELILDYIETHRSITPAKMAGKIYLGSMFGSETSKRCREMRQTGVLESKDIDGFTVYYLKSAHSNALNIIEDEIQKMQEERKKRERIVTLGF